MVASRVALISKKIIKPSSPTPLSHRIHKLSIFDQLNPCSYMAFSLFYPKQYNRTDLPVEPTHISTLFENSLSRALTSYYPSAGTIRNDGIHVECNDVGAKFLEAKIDCPMSEIFNDNSTKAEDLVFPTNLPWYPSKENLVVAQLNHFNCGGIAIGVCVSHKIVDGTSMANFLNHWSAIARNPWAPVPSFQFVGGSIFPPVSVPIAEAVLKSKTRGNTNCISKKYFFSRSKINSLQAMIAVESGTNINPSSVEAVSAFVYKCIASNSTRPSVFTQSMNLRPAMKKRLPEQFQGNASFLLMAPEIADPAEIKLHKLISELKKEKEMYLSQDWETKDVVSTMFEKVESLQYQLERDDDDVDVYKCTSLCRFPFSDMDYGWGSPRRLSLGSVPINKKIFLMDHQNKDGIEVMVSLKEEAMSALENNSNIQEFASPSLGL
nr:inositol acyltransferase [Solanum quitoense]